MIKRNHNKKKSICKVSFFISATLLLLVSCTDIKPKDDPINVGLIAPLTGPLASSGEAVQRGILLGIEDINAKGGLLGRPLALVVRNVQNDPEGGIAALDELVEQEDIKAVFGGIFSPVMVAQLDRLKELQLPLINTWGSMTAITDNGQSPNYAFRVSVSDKEADEFLVRYAVEILGSRHPGIITDTSDWGEANNTGLLRYLSELDIEPVGIIRFNQGETDMTSDLEKLKEAGADSLLLVANAREGASIARSRSLLDWKIPIVSHWGITGGHFVEMAGADHIQDIYTLQTFSFLGELDSKQEDFLQSFQGRFGTKSPEDIQSVVGVVHGFDGINLLAMAIEKTGSTEGALIRTALEDLGEFRGLVKTYKHPFTPDNHDALQVEDYLMTIWKDGYLIPAPIPHLQEKNK